jgi:hypothetical protein
MKLNVLAFALATSAVGSGIEKKTITKETTGADDYTFKTVHKEDITGSKMIHKSNCE